MIYIVHRETGGAKFYVKAFETDEDAIPWKPYQRCYSITAAHTLAKHLNEKHSGTEKQKKECELCQMKK